MQSTPNTLMQSLAPFRSHGERKRARRAARRPVVAKVTPAPLLTLLVSRI
jgi:hypothetical protein